MCLLACLCLFYHLIYKDNMRRVSARQLGSKWKFQCLVLCSWCRQCLRTCEPLHESFRWVDWYHTKSECTNKVLPNWTWISKTSRAGKRDGWYILEEGKTSRRHHFRPYPSRKEQRAGRLHQSFHKSFLRGKLGSLYINLVTKVVMQEKVKEDLCQ